MRNDRTYLIVFVLGTLLCGPVTAQWTSNPETNTPIVTDQRNQRFPALVSDGAGGAIIAWEDERSGNGQFDIYAQRVDATGKTLWQQHGLPVCVAGGAQNRPQMVSDGAGGAILVWKDTRNGDNDIYAQRIGPNGNPLWPVNGVPVVAGPREQGEPAVAPDGQGGVFVVWSDNTFGVTDNDIYVQRISPNGVSMWQFGGVLICSADVYQTTPHVASDGAGGALLVWQDFRTSDFDVYAQKINGSGIPQWGQDGVPVCTASGAQLMPRIISDGNGGAYVIWADKRSGVSNSQIYMQRLSASGAAQWGGGNGTQVSTASSKQDNPSMIGFGVNGFLVSWSEQRSSSYDIYAQRFDNGGTGQWTANGLALCSAAGNQITPYVVPDHAGGAVIVWEDQRAGITKSDIYAQRVASNGTALWKANGFEIGTAANMQTSPAILDDGSGGAFFAFEDYRVGFSNAHIYAHRVLPDGTYPKSPPVAQVTTTPLDFGRVPVSTSKFLTYQVRNAGDAALELLPTTSTAPQFTGRQTLASVAGGAQKLDSVRFAPTALGVVTARIIVPHNASGVPDTIVVHGIGSGTPTIRFADPVIDFGRVKVGRHKDITFALTNEGDDTLHISMIRSFNTAVSFTTTIGRVPPGATFRDTARFGPVALGFTSGAIRVQSNTAAGVDSIPWRGIGEGDADAIISPDRITFGTFDEGSSHDTLVTFTNTGNDTLHVTNIDSDSQSFIAVPAAFSVPPGGQFIDTIRFTPVGEGTFSGTLTVYSNAVSGLLTINTLGFGRKVVGVNALRPVSPLVTLHPAHPHPVSATSMVPFTLSHRATVEMDVIDASGRSVARVASGSYEAGMHHAVLDAGGLPSGSYVLRLRADKVVVTRPLVIMR